MKRQTGFVLLFLIVFLPVLAGCSGSDSEAGAGKDNVNSSGYGQEKRESRLKVPEPLPRMVRCPLSGEMVPQGTTDRRPLAVMIENAPAARPQSGLDKADIIYEILAEGAITRFLAIFLHGDTGELGPVRSARPYYIERMFEYNAMYAYCGGSEEAKRMVRVQGVASLDEFGVGRQAYWRIKDRQAPHNLYTDTEKLRQVGKKRGFEKTVALPKYSFLGDGEENPGGITSDKVIINYLKSYSVVRWDYEPGTRLYLRSNGGKAHKDAVTGKQLTGANIIVQYTKTRVIDNEGRRDIEMVGSGRALLLTGGKLYTGSWSKKDMRSQTFFYDNSGAEWKLSPGQTWIEVIPATIKIEY